MGHHKTRDASFIDGLYSSQLRCRPRNDGASASAASPLAPSDSSASPPSSDGLLSPAMRVLWWHLPCEHRWKSTFVALKQPVISSPDVPESVR